MAVKAAARLGVAPAGRIADAVGRPTLINLPAVVIMLLVTWVLSYGVRESARINNVMVAIKIEIVPFAQFTGIDHPVSLALQFADQNWIAGFVDLGTILGMTTVILVIDLSHVCPSQRPAAQAWRRTAHGFLIRLTPAVPPRAMARERV
ncbi:amino-acid transporter transmembrane protein [Pandoraea communis]|uniref:Amino-acid transporter transmembrane protein n=1 Tax=Pandoraea communis TaxID=2508297 RepID=A0A5E4W9E1_9BURK|nr:amino-acid transporter transmembrane protein [Pandoraea communis]